MDEGHEEASDNIRFRVWSGYYDQDEVFDIVTDEVDEADGEDEEWLRGAIDREFGRKREAERDWPATTDCDRLDRAFESLQGRGILTRHRCGMTIQDGLDVIDRLDNDAGDKRSDLVGYCYYHLQDMEAAMQPCGARSVCGWRSAASLRAVSEPPKPVNSSAKNSSGPVSQSNGTARPSCGYCSKAFAGSGGVGRNAGVILDASLGELRL